MEQYAMYLRKSRLDNDFEENTLLETLRRHEENLDAFASANGYHVVKKYREVVSGETISSRPEVQKLLKEVNNGIYTGVLVVDIDRLARGDSIDQANIAQTFKFSNTKIITLNKTYDPTNETDEDFFEFSLYMSRREYKVIKGRLIRGRENSAKEGKYLGSIPPYGYQRKKLHNQKGYTLEPDPVEAPIVVKIYEKFCNGDGTILIAHYLNDMEIPTRKGDIWSYATISNILKNPVYIGLIKRGWAKQLSSLENGNVVKRVKHMTDVKDYSLYKGMHEPLVSEEQFQLVQNILADKKPEPKVKNDFPLQNSFAGLIFCANCGKRLGRTTDSRGYPRFRCTNHRNCKNGSSSYPMVESQIITALRNWLQGYQLKIDMDDFQYEIDRYNADIAREEKKLTKLQKQLKTAFTLVEDGTYSREEFKQRKAELSEGIETAKEILEHSTALLEDIKTKDYDKKNLVPKMEYLLDSYDNMTPEERNALLKEILVKIVYQKDAKHGIVLDVYPKIPVLKT